MSDYRVEVGVVDKTRRGGSTENARDSISRASELRRQQSQSKEPGGKSISRSEKDIMGFARELRRVTTALGRLDKEALSLAKNLRKAQSASGQGSGGLTSGHLSTKISQLISATSKQTSATERLISALYKAGGGLGSGGRERGGFFGGRGGSFGGRGMGRLGVSFGGMGAALPVAGAAIGAAAYVGNVIKSIGQRYLDTAMQQLGTVGVGGFQRRGSDQYFTAAQMGQYIKGRRLAGGIETPGSEYYVESTRPYTEQEKKSMLAEEVGIRTQLTSLNKRIGRTRERTETNYVAGRGGIPVQIKTKKSESEQRNIEKLQAKRGQLEQSLASIVSKRQGAGITTAQPTRADIAYARAFGLGPEVGQFMGMLDVMNRGRGLTPQSIAEKSGGQFKNVVGAAYGAGRQLELPVMVNAIQGALQEAVQDGVNASNLATDMASELTLYSKAMPNQTIQGAIGLQQSMMQTQRGLTKGQGLTDVMGMRMFTSGRLMLREQLQALKRDPMSGKITGASPFLEQSGITPEYLYSMKKGGIPAPVEYGLVQKLIASKAQSGELNMRTMKDIVTNFEMGLSDPVLRKYQSMQLMETMGLDVTKREAMYNIVDRDLAGPRLKESQERLKEVEAEKSGLKDRGFFGRLFGRSRQEIEGELVGLQENVSKYTKWVEEDKKLTPEQKRKQTEQALQELENRGKGTPVQTAADLRQTREAMSLGEVSASAAQSLVILEKGMYSLAGTASDVAVPALNKLNNLIANLAQYAGLYAGALQKTATKNKGSIKEEDVLKAIHGSSGTPTE